MFILLDIDGVMVPASSWKRPEFLEDGFPVFSSGSVNALRRLLSETSTRIVLTTSHKFKYELIEWKEMFSRRGIETTEISRLSDNIENLNRKDEILKWYNSTAISEEFVIIDDDKSLNALPEVLKNKLVQTSGTVGLTEEWAEKAIRILSK